MAATSAQSPGKCLKKLRVFQSTPEKHGAPQDPNPEEVSQGHRSLGNAFAAAAGTKDPWDFVRTKFHFTGKFVIFHRDPTSCTLNLKDPKECTLSAQ